LFFNTIKIIFKVFKNIKKILINVFSFIHLFQSIVNLKKLKKL